MKNKEPTVGDLVAKKREIDGYDPEFEALLAEKYRCPQCGHEATIQKVLICINGNDDRFGCPQCRTPGMERVGTAHLTKMN